MIRFDKILRVSVLLLISAAGSAAAGPFTFTPGAAGLNGGTFAADTLVISDNAQITFGSNGTTFVDTGYLAVTGFRLNGQDVGAPGFQSADGSGWGAYIRYSGGGTQVVSPGGSPLAATFQQLTYSFVAYNGLATFGFADDGSATTGGAVRDVRTVGTGSLISGGINFTFPPGQAAPSIVGQLTTLLTGAGGGLIQGQPTGLEVNFVHPPNEYVFTSATTLQVTGGSNASAVLTVPEPASAALLAAGLAGAGLLGRRRGAGSSRAPRVSGAD